MKSLRNAGKLYRGGFIPYLNIKSQAKEDPYLTSKTGHFTSHTITTDITSQRINIKVIRIQ